ncbi:hypothetical protein ABGV42_01830 [Paenibacillus pabuli]|uniref:hypothetical protein n=1 Tax=Paenibacillus pabuli TaxID=1472 RepID=UPI00324201C2
MNKLKNYFDKIKNTKAFTFIFLALILAIFMMPTSQYISNQETRRELSTVSEKAAIYEKQIEQYKAEITEKEAQISKQVQSLAELSTQVDALKKQSELIGSKLEKLAKLTK